MFRVLKSSPAPDAGQLDTFTFDDLSQPHGRELHAARRHAEEILAAARLEADALREEALQHARAQARCEFDAAVNARVEEQLQTLLPAVREGVSTLERVRAECLTRWEQAGLNVALAIAERVIRREVERTPQIALSLVREALELAAGSTDVTLTMHPDDARDLEPQLDQLLSELGRLGACRVVPTPGVTRGGCRVETRLGSIDQQIETQLSRIAEELG